jgi:hypothetical protein
MMNMIKYLKYLVVLIIIVITSFILILKNTAKSSEFRLEIIRLDSGWGYKISKHNKPLILQEYIPAIKGNHPFPDKKYARETGKIVLKKLRNHESPRISKEELRDSAHIFLNMGAVPH